LGSAEIGVVAVDPVLARRREEVEVDGVFEGEDFVGDVGWDGEDFVGTEDDFADRGVRVSGVRGFSFRRFVEEELEAAVDGDGDLFVVVAVQGDVCAFLQRDAGDHDVGAYDELAAEEGVHGFDGDVGPVGVDGGC